MIIDVHYRDCGDGSFEILGVDNNKSYGFVYPKFIDPITAQPYLDD